MKHFTLTALGGLLLASTAAHASLELVGPQQFNGTGLGAVDTVLTLQSPGNTTTEAGAVSVGANNMQMISGDAKTGASQTTLRTFGELGVGSAADLRIVFNAAEPGNANNGITLNDLVLNVYSPTGAVLFTSGAFDEQDFGSTFTGIGKSGFVFKLDDAQAAAAQAALGSDFMGDRIGLSASLSGATGGPETFYLTSVTAPVPEPATDGLMAVGVAATALIARRRRAR